MDTSKPTDDVSQLEAYRQDSHFRGWPAPACSVGEALDAELEGAVLAGRPGAQAWSMRTTS